MCVSEREYERVSEREYECVCVCVREYVCVCEGVGWVRECV